MGGRRLAVNDVERLAALGFEEYRAKLLAPALVRTAWRVDEVPASAVGFRVEARMSRADDLHVVPGLNESSDQVVRVPLHAADAVRAIRHHA